MIAIYMKFYLFRMVFMSEIVEVYPPEIEQKLSADSYCNNLCLYCNENMGA